VPVYPGVYQAKATKVDRLSVEALVPQIFGDAPVIVQRFMGPLPATTGSGWVMFMAGNPEYPVWCSGVSTISAVPADESASIFITRDYRWSEDVTTSDPGAGRIKVDSHDPEGASQICISAYDLGNTAFLTLLSLTAGDLIAIYLSGDVTTRIEYTLGGLPVNNTGWFVIPLEGSPSNYGFSPLNNTQVKVTVQTVGSGGGGGPATGMGSYVHNQGASAATWVVVHNLGGYPNVVVEDSSGTTIEGEIVYNNSNQLTLTFSAAFSGVAYCS
jgi:hypothetical protein